MITILWISISIFAVLLQNCVQSQTIFRYQCPQGCLCVPDIADAELLMISCRWQKLHEFTETFPKNATRTLAIQCINQDTKDENEKFAERIFSGFDKLLDLRISHCKTNALKAEMFQGIPQLRRLHLSDIGSAPLILKKNIFDFIKPLERLSLINSKLEDIENEAFCSLRFLQILNISSNHLKQAKIGVDSSSCLLDHLIMLDLSGNEIRHITSNEFNGFPSLRQLRLSSNGLRHIGKDLFKSINLLQHLDLDNNELEEMVPLPDSIMHINLAQNQLNNIPASVANLLSLMSLNVSENLIDSTTPFSLLSSSIEVLDLSSNRLSKIPLRLFRESVDTITILNLAKNNITEIQPHFLQNFTHLKELDISNNEIKSLPFGIFNGLNELLNLKINNNLIYHIDIEVFNELGKKLTTLSMSNNLLTELPMAIGRLSRIKNIDLSSNKIKTAYKFVLNKINHLARLDLSNNELLEIDSYIFSDSAHLSELILKRNKITKINNDAFEKCPKLKKIDLAENQLKQIGSSLGSINSLRILNISNNLLEMLDWNEFPNELQELHANGNNIHSISRVTNSGVKIMNLRQNRLQTIEAEQLPPLLEEINIGENHLQQISKHSFIGKTQLKIVNVQNNSLKTVPEGIFEQSQVINPNFPGHLYISGNPLICNCEMAWITNTTARNMAVRIVDIVESNCALPLSHKITSMHNASNDDYLCRYNKSCEPGCICCQFENCDCKSKCPDGCECFRDINYKTNIVKCHSTTGQKIPVRDLPMLASHIYMHKVNLPVLRSHDFIGRMRLSQLHIISSGLHTIEPLALNTLPKLRVLNLSGNNLRKINGDESFKTNRLQKLNIEQNDIVDIDMRLTEIMPNLETLYAAENSMEDLPKYLTTETANEKLKSITLGDNPFRCDCSTTHRFKTQEWLQRNHERVKDVQKVYCVENITQALLFNDSTVLTSFAPNLEDDLFTMPMLDFVYHENRSLCIVQSEGFFGGTATQNVIFISLIAIVVIIIITGLFYFLLSALKDKSDKTNSSQTRLKMTNSLTSSADRTQGYSPLPSDSMNHFDAFISYSKDDEEMVLKELCRPLESQDLTLFLLHQDGRFNYNDGWQSISDELNRQVQVCQTLIIVITKRFLEKEWKTVQIKTSHQLFAKMKNKKLIAILSEEVDPNELNDELGQILRKNTRIWRSNPLFWNLLMSELPQRDSPVASETSQVYSDMYGSIVPSELV